MNKKVLLGISGGVDSAVSAHILKAQGFDVTAVNCLFYKNGHSDTNAVEDARAVSQRLGIPFRTADMTDSFREKVIENFARTYVKGGTPNPCIVCNKQLKFGAMLERALEEGFDYIATGHYARIEKDAATGRYLLKKGLDPYKDQSYVLYCLNQKQLSHTLFPLGEMTKEQSRALAQELELVNAKKGDSQDICFIPDGDYAAFIERYLGKTFPEGSFTDTDGNILGTHKGIIRYTIGQRKGLGLALPAPMYVKEKDIERNRVILSDNESLFSKELYADNINLITCDRLDGPVRVKAKIRYAHKEQWATVTQENGDLLHIVFDEPQRAVARGQSAVLYDKDTVVGGGIIL
ncbi:MAG: tRNA 2-thiouridine(34) synthase MnmA [Ruminococcaceae bacterium]|nr:tRNA 2-thiouridine(34) synthase MnmA [Oscillospiraceae bacterium]